MYNNARERPRLHSTDIPPAKYSPWRSLLLRASDDAFLLMTGFTRQAFLQLEQAVLPQYEYRMGRPLKLDFRDQLGLYLFYVGSKLRIKDLAFLFYVLPCTASLIIKRMRILIVKGLRTEAAAAIRFPDQPTMVRLAAMVQVREPLVDNVIGFADGFSIAIQCSRETFDQNAFYDGYLHDTMVNNVLIFSPEGKVISAAINYPGSWHDSTVANGIMDTCESRLGNFAICVDQGCPRSGRLLNKFVGPLSLAARRNLHDLLNTSKSSI